MKNEDGVSLVAEKEIKDKLTAVLGMGLLLKLTVLSKTVN